MKVLAIHNFHRKGSASGDDQVFKSETALMENHGIEVVRYTVSNDEFDHAGILGKIKATLGMLWSFKNKNRTLYIFILFFLCFRHRYCMQQKGVELKL